MKPSVALNYKIYEVEEASDMTDISIKVATYEDVRFAQTQMKKIFLKKGSAKQINHPLGVIELRRKYK